MATRPLWARARGRRRAPRSGGGGGSAPAASSSKLKQTGTGPSSWSQRWSASLSAPARTGKNIGQRQFETGKHVPAGERLSFANPAQVGGRGVCLGCLRFRVDQPHQADPGQEILTQLSAHLLRRVSLAQDLHCQVGNQLGDGFIRQFLAGEPL